MHAHIVLTLTGPDRVGLVERVTGILLELGGNIAGSRMTRLGGEFAMLMLLSLPDGAVERVEPALASLRAEGYATTVVRTDQDGTRHAGWLPYEIEVAGADHEGIMHDIAAGLARSGITIETMETETAPAPDTGTPLFSMKARVLVPPHLGEADWTSTLAQAGEQANVDVTVSSARQ